MKTRRELDDEGAFLCEQFAKLVKNHNTFPSHEVKELLEHFNKWDKEVEFWHRDNRRKRQLKILKNIERSNR